MGDERLTDDAVARAVLARYGTTYAEEAGIRLADEPAPLFQLLVLAQLLSARIGAGVAVATAAELFAAGWTTPARLRDAGRGRVVAALGRGGYRRYDERTATQLREMTELVLARYDGDLRGLAAASGQDPGRASVLVQEVKGIGPTGAAVLLREVQAVWPWVRPCIDGRARAGARRVGLPDTAAVLAALVAGDDLARFAAALVRVSLLPASQDALSG
ncbi:endonuclease [Blastococcus haudaquaticus]|nr:endonuclease [Blastococcus haudaquaticus]